MFEIETQEFVARGEEPELSDEALEEVAGGGLCSIDGCQTVDFCDTLGTPPTFPTDGGF
ncbi:MAG TPA: hypothetical protein VF746_03535 [Longimicrobium sp.]|jgi:hypothetical protein